MSLTLFRYFDLLANQLYLSIGTGVKLDGSQIESAFIHLFPLALIVLQNLKHLLNSNLKSCDGKVEASSVASFRVLIALVIKPECRDKVPGLQILVQRIARPINLKTSASNSPTRLREGGSRSNNT